MTVLQETYKTYFNMEIRNKMLDIANSTIWEGDI